MTKLAIISDSHGGLDRLHSALENIQTAGIKIVLHAGDCVMGNFAELLGSFPDIKFFIARGNCDIDEAELMKIRALSNVELQDLIETNIADKKIAIAHRIEDLNGVEADIYISGHTHIPRIEKVGAQIWINPGSLFDSHRYLILDMETLELEGKLFNEKI